MAVGAKHDPSDWRAGLVVFVVGLVLVVWFKSGSDTPCNQARFMYNSAHNRTRMMQDRMHEMSDKDSAAYNKLVDDVRELSAKESEEQSVMFLACENDK
jgi:formiminotetrahydrofolate cyclodeaminase